MLILLISLKLKTGGGKNNKIKYIPNYTRFLCNEEEKWKLREQYTKISIKLGQRKLFFNELEFYNYVYTKNVNANIVYAGAASGSHTYYLSKLFPSFNFHLYDPNEFNKNLYECPNVSIHNIYFPPSDWRTPKFLNGNDIYFLSDIRTGKEEKYINEDMQLQKEWCQDNPQIKFAMLKFRLSWEPGKTKYFSGEIYTQPRTGSTSTETRLWTDCKNMRDWDNDSYNNRVFYYQVHERNAFYEFTLPNVQGFDHCHDCWSEKKISDEYIKLKITDKNPLEVAMNFSRIDIPPHGLYRDEKDINKKILLLKDITINFFKSDISKNRYSEADKYDNLQTLSWIRNPFVNFNFGLLHSSNKYVFDLLNKNKELKFTRNVYDIPRSPIIGTEVFDACGFVRVRRGEFLMNLEFLSDYPSENIIIITDYISRKYEKLASFFPNRKFIFYFPFKNPNINAPNIEFLYRYPDKDELKQWRGKDVNLIINIKTFQKKLRLETFTIAPILSFKIANILQPKMAMYNIFGVLIDVELHDGIVKTIPFGLFSAPVCKLITDCKKTKIYRKNDLLERLFTFNFCNRLVYYDMDIPIKTAIENKISVSCNGIDHCHDCRTESEIWLNFLGKTDSIIENMTDFIEKDEENELRSYPHGMLPNLKDTSKKIHLLTLYTLYYHNTRLSFTKTMSIKKNKEGTYSYENFGQLADYEYKEQRKYYDEKCYAFMLKY